MGRYSSEEFAVYEGLDGIDPGSAALQLRFAASLAAQAVKDRAQPERRALRAFEALAIPTLYFPFQGYGYISQGYHSGHPAIDFPYPRGTPIYAAHDGEVVEAGLAKGGFSGYAYHIKIVNHEYKIATLYAHLLADGGILVKRGQQVKAKQLIGRGNSTGNSTGDHLHFELLKYPYRSYTSDAIDPRPYLVRWIPGDDGDGKPTPPPPPPTGCTGPTVKMRVIKQRGKLSIYRRPDKTSPVIGHYSKGDVVCCEDVADALGSKQDWWKTSKGYVMKKNGRHINLQFV